MGRNKCKTACITNTSTNKVIVGVGKLKTFLPNLFSFRHAPYTSLNSYFSTFGRIEDIVVPYITDTNIKNGYAIITFESKEAVKLVVNSSPHIIEGNTPLDVRYYPYSDVDDIG